MAGVGAMVAAAAPYLMGASAGLQAVSGIVGASQAGAAGRAEARAYERQAEAARAVAKNQAAQERDKYRRLVASQRAGLGASGVDVNAGSALDVLADTDAEGDVSAMQLLYSGELEAWKAKQKAKAAKAEAASRAGSSLLGGVMGALGTGLGGLGSLSGGAAKAGTAAVSKKTISNMAIKLLG